MLNSQTPNEIEFVESKKQYILSLLIFLIGIGFNVTVSVIFGSPLIGIAVTLSSLYILLISVKIQFQWSMNNFFHAIIPIVILLYILSTLSIGGPLTILLVFLTTLVMITTTLPFSSHVYSMQLHFTKETNHLQITYNKLFVKIVKDINVNSENFLQLKYTHLKLPDLFFTKGIFHKLIFENFDGIYIAPVNANGFTLVNKLLRLLEPHELHIDGITRTNAKLAVPQSNSIKLILPVEKSIPSGFHPIEELQNLDSLSNFEYLTPKDEKMSKAKALFIISFLVVVTGIIMTAIAILPNNLDLPVRIAFLFFMVPNTILLVIITFVIIIHVITIWFGKFTLEIGNDSLQMIYNLNGIHRVNIEIHNAFNPLMKIENNNVYICILNQDREIFYKHRIGRLEADDVTILGLIE